MAIRGCIADPAFAVSYAGDEFVIVLPEQDRSGATAVATEIRSRLAARQFLATAGYAIRLTASFGVAVYPDDAGAMEKLLAIADRALFTAKGEGRNRIGVAGSEPVPSSPTVGVRTSRAHS